MKARALIVAAAAVALAHSLWVGAVTDDAGIALAYARTFASGEGLRLTALSPRVEAYSDPLWVLWLSLGYVLRVGGAQFAHVSGAAFGALAVLFAGWVPSRAEGREVRALDAIAPWVLALDTTYNFWAGAGLESGAFALALSLSLAFAGALPAGLLAVLRPEGAVYAALLAPFRRPMVRWLAVAALPALAWLAFRRIYYGQWLPNAWYAKKQWDYGGLAYLRSWFFADPWHWALLLTPLALLSPRTRRAALLCASACAAAVVFIAVSRGDWMAEHRFVAHALPAAAVAAGLVPLALDDLFRQRALAVAAALALGGAAFTGAWTRSPARQKDPVLPLAYISEQGRWFRQEAQRLGLTRPRVAHFDIGGVALESGGEVIDLAGLADLYIGRVGYQAQDRVRDYVFGEVKPEFINIHGPCRYLRDDVRLARDYRLAATGLWGENWERAEGRCSLPADLLQALQKSTPAQARDLWLCARSHLSAGQLPDVRPLAARLADQGLRLGDRDLLEAAVTLDPTLVRAAQRLLTLRLVRPR